MRRAFTAVFCISFLTLPLAADGLSPVRAALYGMYTPAPRREPARLRTGKDDVQNSSGSRSRKYTYWAVTGLGIASGIGGLVNAGATAGAYAEYQAATISYDAERLGDRMERIGRKSMEQLSLSAFFTVISIMMSMDGHFSGGR